VFSVTTEEEALQLITLTCPTDLGGRHYARELANEQTLENLYAFSDHLAEAHALLKKKGLCKCQDH